MNPLVWMLLIEAIVIAAVVFYLHHVEKQYLAQRRRDTEIIRREIERRKRAHAPLSELRKQLVKLVAEELRA